MAIIKCKMCGGDIELSSDKTFGTCEYCGSATTLPKISDEQRAAAFNRGNHFRRIGEFDKALAVYERIVREDDTDAEAYWCCALCRFGIEYVEDPVTYEWLPTCHRASFDSFMEDVDYKAALEYSQGITHRQYLKDGAKIAEVQRGILATSSNEEPFDVFICYKETDARGERTRDSIMAQDIYYQLTERDHRVFFARITLEDVAGAQYEPYIFAALNSAKVMVVVGTSHENLNAVWVKNEWSRFLSMMKRDRSKVILPCYRDMDPYDMPEQLSVFQSYDMSKIGFIQDLIHGINKIVRKPIEQGGTAAAVAGPAPARTSNYDSAIIMGFMDLEMGKNDSAANTFRQVLMQDSTCPEAYLGLLLISPENEQAMLREKFQKYAAENMSDLEKKVFTPNTRERILMQYCTIKGEVRISDAVRLYGSAVTPELFVTAIHQTASDVVARTFIASGIDINAVSKCNYSDGSYEEKTPLHLAVLDNAYDVVKLLLENGADPNKNRLRRTQNGDSWCSALHDSIWKHQNTAMASLLLNFGADVEYIAKEYFDGGVYEERTPLNRTVQYNMYDLAKLLLENGADANTKRLYRNKMGDSWFSALSDSVWNFKNYEIAALLIEYGADVHYINRGYSADGVYFEKTLLHEAVLCAEYRIVKLLLEHGADPNSVRLYRDKKGDWPISALSDCVWYVKNYEIAVLLLEYGADPNFKRKYMGDNSVETYSILSDAIWNIKDIAFVELLLKNGANPSDCNNKQFRDGHCEHESMLHCAVEYAKSPEMVRLLIKHGASLQDTTTHKGKTIPFKKFPYHVYGDMRETLMAVGWKGPGIFGFR